MLKVLRERTFSLKSLDERLQKFIHYVKQAILVLDNDLRVRSFSQPDLLLFY
jgi:hypothetical protein